MWVHGCREEERGRKRDRGGGQGLEDEEGRSKEKGNNDMCVRYDADVCMSVSV